MLHSTHVAFFSIVIAQPGLLHTRVDFSQYEFCTRGKVGEKARGRYRFLIALRHKLSQIKWEQWKIM